MADLSVTALTELTSPATNDELGIWDVSAGQYKKITQANLLGGAMTGGGTVATGGYTLTVPATGTAALLAVANTFTAKQTINVTSGAVIDLKYNGNTVLDHTPSATSNQLIVREFDMSGGAGASITLQRNTNSSTPASGFVRIDNIGGSGYRIWPDTSGNLRIHGSNPTNANDTAGTVVGTQTSMADAKYLYSELSPLDEVLQRIVAGADAVRSFVYRSGAFNRQRFEGVVTDYAPDYGMDRDAEHPAGKSLNEIQIAGDLLRAVAYLTRRVQELERLVPGS